MADSRKRVDEIYPKELAAALKAESMDLGRALTDEEKSFFISGWQAAVDASEAIANDESEHSHHNYRRGAQATAFRVRMLKQHQVMEARRSDGR